MFTPAQRLNLHIKRPYNRDDVLTVNITEDMIEEAKKNAESLKISIGQKTRAAIEDRDIIGSLAHQAVENKLIEMGRTFISMRNEIKTSGNFTDSGDIIYGKDIIDVKGTHGSIQEQYFYNQQFLVFDSEITSIEEKGITHFVFVLVDVPNREAYIFGAISYLDFQEKSVPVTLKWENHGIKSRQLTPFISYINHTI